MSKNLIYCRCSMSAPKIQGRSPGISLSFYGEEKRVLELLACAKKENQKGVDMLSFLAKRGFKPVVNKVIDFVLYPEDENVWDTPHRKSIPIVNTDGKI